MSDRVRLPNRHPDLSILVDMTSRLATLALLVLAPLALTSCGGGGDDDTSGGSTEPGAAATTSSVDRSAFVPITTGGVAAVVDRHLGDRVQKYYTFKGDTSGAKERYLGVRLKDGDPRDTFLVSVYAQGGSGGEVVAGPCPGTSPEPDPMATVTCLPVAGGGNVTITQFATGFEEGNKAGSYLTASGTGPEEREATASYESFSKQPPLSDEELGALLGDPYLGWETAARFNEAGKSLKVAQEE